METMMRAPCLAGLCLVASAAQARPYQIEDMLRLESFGQIVIDPTEHMAVIERRAAYRSSSRFDYGYFTVRALSKLEAVDLNAPAAARPLFAQDAGAGYWSGGFSPSGRRLAVFRLENGRLSLGILDMRSRAVRWLRVAPDLPTANPSPIWRDDETLIYVARPAGDLPSILQSGNLTQRRSAIQWAAQVAGETPSVTAFGSGAYRNVGLADGNMSIVRINIADGASRTIARGSVSDLALSADRRQLAILLRTTPPLPVQGPVDPASQPRKQRLVVADLETGTSRDICPSCDVLQNLLSWSPRGADLLFFARHDGETWDAGHLYRADPANTSASALPFRPEVRILGGSSYVVNAGWWDAAPIAFGRMESGGAPGWYRLSSGPPVQIVSGGADSLVAASGDRVYTIANGALVGAVANQAPQPVLEGRIVAVGVDYLDPYSIGSRGVFNRALDSLPAVMTRNGEMVVSTGIDAATGTSAWSVGLPASGAQLLAATARGAVIYLRSDGHGAGHLILARPHAEDREIDSINSDLAAIDPAERIAIHSTAPDGTILTHWLTVPPADGALPPLIVIPYPGLVRPDAPPPALTGATFQPVVNPLLLVAAGYAVLEPSLPRDRPEGDLAAGYVDVGARDPAARASADPITRMTEIVLGAVDAAAATGRVDAHHVALYGHSFGAYSVIGIASRANCFSAVVAANGPYDLLAAYGRLPPQANHEETGIQLTGPFGWFERGQGALGGPPWQLPRVYLQRSPFYSVERIHAPVLLIHGELERLGRDAILLRYAGEGHLFASPANIRDSWGRTLDFLDTHLGRTRGRSQTPITRPGLEAREQCDHPGVLVPDDGVLGQ
jgi:dipeptidyl aminopeptidase/acylaminoacyl peptidase